ncbi:hypothetical protein LXL04_004807 [Taraxacum kok-saghyz]
MPTDVWLQHISEAQKIPDYPCNLTVAAYNGGFLENFGVSAGVVLRGAMLINLSWPMLSSSSSSSLRILSFPPPLRYSFINQPLQTYSTAISSIPTRAARMGHEKSQLISQTSHALANFRLCNVSGRKTELVEIHARDPKFHVLFIPGNPGVVSFYTDFLESLYEQMGETASITAAIGHISHSEKENRIQAQTESITALKTEMNQNHDKGVMDESSDAFVFSILETPKTIPQGAGSSGATTPTHGGPSLGGYRGSGDTKGGQGNTGGGGFHHSSGGEHGGGNHWRFRKLDMPLFDGSNPDGWILRAERYFRFYKLPEEDKIEAAVVSLEGDALLWYQWEHGRRPIRGWEELKAVILRRFRSVAAGKLYEQWLTVSQTGTVTEYQRKFIEFSAPLSGVTEEVAMGQFINGLKKEIRAEVRVMNPRSLDQAMELAIRIEDKINASSGRATYSKNQTTTGFTPRNLLSTTTTATSGGAMGGRNTTTGWNPKTGREVRRLTEKELQDKKDRGLCFRCDEKWQIGHQCKRKELSIMLNLDEEDEQEIPEEKLEPDPETEVCLNSVLGITKPKTMKLAGKLNEENVVVMIDPGATHNFISPETVERGNIPITGTGEFGVALGTGVRVQGKGICKQVKLQLQGIEIVEDFLPLNLGNSDIILGIQWLAKLGPVTTNWRTQSMQFQMDGKTSVLQGDSSLECCQVSLKTMMKTLKNQKGGYYVQVNQVDGEGELTAGPTPEFLTDLIQDFQDVFNMPEGLPPTRGREHLIRLNEGTNPVNVRPYRYPQIQKEEISKLTKEMLKAGIIQPSISPFSSPVLLVKKKNGAWRFCVDYRALNKVTVADKYPIPIIDELLDELHGAQLFTKLDLKSGYHQIRVKAEDVPKTAFRTHEGHYEFLVMPFGLTNAPATFQSLMNDIFRPFLRKFVLVFFDDILIYSRTRDQHREHVSKVLLSLREHQLYVNHEKCNFGQESVAYLGHVISGQGVAVDPEKIKAIVEWKSPATLRELRGFLGLTGYYRKFIRGYASIAAPMTDLLKKGNFYWSHEAEKSFAQLKEIMTTAPILAMPDFQQVFIIETDASGYGVGAVLMQEGHPIAYYSQVLGTRNRTKPIYEKELIAIVWAVQKWRHFLLGRHFIIRTDQKSLRFSLEQWVIRNQYQKWVCKLMGYQFKIHYKKGTTNMAADALSRKLETDSELQTISSTTVFSLEDVYKEIEQDRFIQQLKAQVQAHLKPFPGFRVDHGRLYYQDRLVLPPKSPFIAKLLMEYHDSAAGGHSGDLKTYHRLAREWYWDGMRKDIKKYVQECAVCQQQKHSTTRPAGLLQPLDLPNQVWEAVTMDFVEGLPKSYGVDVILVVVDRLSKYAHLMGLKHPFTAESVAKVFIKEIVRLHGFPTSIVSDRDRIFISKFWRELFRLQGTTLKRSTSYHPQTDGQSEVVNKTIETYLRCFISGNAKEWARWLPWAEFWYNTSHHVTIKCTPFKALYGRDPPGVTRYEKGQTAVASLEDQLVERDAILDELKFNILRAQQRMKTMEDKKRREVEYQVGDRVYLKLQPYRQKSVKSRPCEKLSPPSIPCIAAEKNHRGSDLEDISKTKVDPEELLGVRIREQSRENRREVLIKWKGMPEAEATWEDFLTIGHLFPSFHLEDKVAVWGGSIAKPPIRFTYSRRGTKVGSKIIAERLDWEHGKLFGLKEQIDHKINFIQQELQPLEVPLIVVGHSIGSYMSLEVYKKIPEKVAYFIGLYPFLAVDTESQPQSIIKKLSRSHLASSMASATVALFGFLPNQASKYIAKISLGKSWSTTALDALCTSVLKYHTMRNVLYMVMTEFEELDKVPDWEFMREKQNRIAFLYGEDDHWAPLHMHDEIVKQVPDAIVEVEKEGHTHAFSCTTTGSKWVARHVATLINKTLN